MFVINHFLRELDKVGSHVFLLVKCATKRHKPLVGIGLFSGSRRLRLLNGNGATQLLVLSLKTPFIFFRKTVSSTEGASWLSVTVWQKTVSPKFSAVGLECGFGGCGC